MTAPKRPRRKHHGGTNGSIKAAVGTTPGSVSHELYGAIHVPHPRDFRPLLRPDGPFFGSGV